MARVCTNPACVKSYPDDAAFCGECGTITVQVQDGPTRDERIGQQIGAYRVVAHVADGAMGRVYEGRHPSTRERVAIKVLHPEVARDGVSVERFKREFETARDMAHANIVKVIAFGSTEDGLPFMTMEFLEGEELGQALRRGAPLAAARVVRLCAQLAEGLDYAHASGYIHRDLKPDNVFLCKSAHGDVVRVLDFGSVKLQIETGPKLTAFGTTLGSPYYMSPEQAMGKQDVDARTDVFALGAIVYECLTGKIAFEAGNVAQILMKIISAQPIPPSQQRAGLPPRLDDVIERALKKDKNERYASASALAQGLLVAYGLEPDVARWAKEDEQTIARSLAQASPPPARAFTESSPSMPPRESRVSSFPRGLPTNSGLWIGVTVGALALVAALAALLLR